MKRPGPSDTQGSMKKLATALRQLFTFEKPPVEDEDALRAEFKNRYHHFRQLLIHDREVHESMVDMEEALHGDEPFDMHFVRRCVTSAGTATYQMVRRMSALAPGRYDTLEQRLKVIQANILPHISPPAKAGEGPLVIPLSELTRENMDLAGPKMSYLGEAGDSLGVRIPDGFVITAEAYSRFMAHNGLGEEIMRRIQSADLEDSANPEEALFRLSSSVQQLILSTELPDDVVEAILSSIDAMASNGQRLRLAMRSSALGEDVPGASFAGQYESQLGISRDEALINYATVVASKYNRQAMSYRMHKGIREEDVAMCVGVMRMIDAQAGGVAYSGGALSSRDDTISVFSTFGLPKTVVDGTADVDTFRFTRGDSLQMAESSIVRKEASCICREDEGTCSVQMEEEICEQPSLTDEQALEVARLAMRLERYFGVAQDLEWALDETGAIVLLQSRALPRPTELDEEEMVDDDLADEDMAGQARDAQDESVSDGQPPHWEGLDGKNAAGASTNDGATLGADDAGHGEPQPQTDATTPPAGATEAPQTVPAPPRTTKENHAGAAPQNASAPEADDSDAPNATDSANGQDSQSDSRQAAPEAQATSGSEGAADAPSPAASPLLQGGSTASGGKGHGTIFIARTKADLLLFPDGGILVVRQALPSWAPLIHRAAGVISEMGTVAGHLANIAREFGVPALFGLKGALDSLEAEAEVTLDADACAVYPGRIESLLTQSRPRASALRGTPVHTALFNATRHILPLNLLDPDSPDFRPRNCRTLHDILRFCHERAVREMFSYWQKKRFPRATAKQLHHNGPKQFWVLDLDDGFAHEVEGKFIKLEEIVSIPMLALWEGMNHQPWQGPPPINASGFLSVMFQATANTALEPSMATHYTHKNYFMVSRNFASLQSRFGFHFCGAEALVGERSPENYAGFRFRGGAADRNRRMLRAQLVADLLQERDFRIRLHGDSLSARVEGFDVPEMEKRLRMLGYLIMHTRQLDMIMANRAEAERKRRELSGMIDAFFTEAED